MSISDLVQKNLPQPPVAIKSPPPSERDQSLVNEYRDYYRTLFRDRRAYTARLRTFQLAPYGETLVDGGPVSNLLTDFAVVNEIPACTPPNELGGGR